MKNNPVVPYILIMAFGIGLIFFLSFKGAGNEEDHAGDSESTGDAQLVQQCISCHGGNLEGGMGPALVGQDSDYIVDVLVNGIEGSAAMKPGFKSEAEAQAIAEYISSLE